MDEFEKYAEMMKPIVLEESIRQYNGGWGKVVLEFKLASATKDPLVLFCVYPEDKGSMHSVCISAATYLHMIVGFFPVLSHAQNAYLYLMKLLEVASGVSCPEPSRNGRMPRKNLRPAVKWENLNFL